MRPARLSSSIAAQGANPAPATTVRRGATAAREHVGDRAQNQMQANAERQTAPARSLPFGIGNLIKAVSFAANANTVISHKLGASYSGAMVMVPSAAARFAVNASNDKGVTDRQITIVADAACTADVWVYQ